MSSREQKCQIHYNTIERYVSPAELFGLEKSITLS